MLKNCRENCRKNCKGFTLLELLVVVIIIGILAAIALPQYKKAVLKSRFATVKTNVKVLADAMERYYMINNVYSTKLEDLDISVKPARLTDYYINFANVAGRVLSSSGKPLLTYYVYKGGGSALCIAFEGPSSGNSESTRLLVSKICHEETGKTTPSAVFSTYSNYEY